MLFRRASRLPTAVMLPLLGIAAGCADCGPAPDPQPAGKLCGQGQIDGADHQIDPAGTRLALVIHKVDAFGCGALHSHVVLAPTATFTYDLDSAAAGEVTIVVPTAALDPDDPDLRLELLGPDEGQPLSEGDRESIRGSVGEEVKAQEFSTMTFTLKNLSTLDGAGTATLVSEIAGETSETEVAYTAAKDGDKVRVTGTAVIDGGPHGIPRNALGFCVQKDMDLDFAVVLSPGTTVCNEDVPDPEVYVPQEFPDAECGTVGYNVVYNNVVGPRCMGCHGGTFPGNDELLRGGATVPLVAWEDFRVDSVRNQGTAMYLKAHEYVNLDPLDPEVLAMPPAANGEATALQETLLDATGVPDTITTELQLFNAWVEEGLGRDAQCDNDVAKKSFGNRVEPAANCDGEEPLHYDEAQAENGDASAKDFFENNCMSCHATGLGNAPSAAVVGAANDETGEYTTDFAAGAQPVSHPFYIADDGGPLSFWQASIHRTEDGSMFPGSAPGAYEGDPSFEAYKAWVAAGYCE